MNEKVLGELVKLADSLDKRGFKVEADMVDGILKTAGDPLPFQKRCPGKAGKKCKNNISKSAKLCKDCSGSADKNPAKKGKK